MTLDTFLEADWRPAANFEPRRDDKPASILLFHYTGMESAPKAVDWLCQPNSRVSCHYLVDEAGHITQMVHEEMRAWHAGESYWAGETDINSASIGIEIANPGHLIGYTDFPELQMQAVEALSRRHHRAPRDQARTGSRPFRRGTAPQMRSWREIRLGEAGGLRGRALGRAGPDRGRCRAGAGGCECSRGTAAGPACDLWLPDPRLGHVLRRDPRGRHRVPAAFPPCPRQRPRRQFHDGYARAIIAVGGLPDSLEHRSKRRLQPEFGKIDARTRG